MKKGMKAICWIISIVVIGAFGITLSNADDVRETKKAEREQEKQEQEQRWQEAADRRAEEHISEYEQYIRANVLDDFDVKIYKRSKENSWYSDCYNNYVYYIKCYSEKIATWYQEDKPYEFFEKMYELHKAILECPAHEKMRDDQIEVDDADLGICVTDNNHTFSMIIYTKVGHQYELRRSDGTMKVLIDGVKKHQSSLYVPSVPEDKPDYIPESNPTLPNHSYDPYDVHEYDNPDDFADEWAEEFASDPSDYDAGYDDAYDYWMEEYGG